MDEPAVVVEGAINILQLELDLKLPKVVNPVQVFFFPFLLLCLKVQKDAAEKKLKPAQLVSQSHNQSC